MSGLHITVELSDDQLAEIAARVAEMIKANRPPADDPWVNTRQAAEHLGCPIGRIHDLVQLGKLTPHRDGRKLKFKRSTLDAYLEEGSPRSSPRVSAARTACAAIGVM